MHPQPLHRFDAKYTGEEPSALGAHAGICAGGVPGDRHSYRDRISTPKISSSNEHNYFSVEISSNYVFEKMGNGTSVK